MSNLNNDKITSKSKGRLTLPSEQNFYDETLEMIEKLGADVLRDSDGTELPEDVKDIEGVKIYGKYFPARGHNDFAVNVPFEWSRYYLLSGFVTASSNSLEIHVTADYYSEQIVPDYDYDPKEWWEVVDRTTGEVVDPSDWEVDQETHVVTINTQAFHVYSVTFLAYGVWDPVHMYNSLTNDWQDVPKDIPFDARYPKSAKFVEERLEEWLQENPKVDVVRFTTFFYQFSLVFNKDGDQKYVDWFGYTNSVSPEAMKAFEAEYGYKLRPEDFVDQGYYNAQARVPSQEYLDYIDFQSKFVSEGAKRLVDLCHQYGKKAIMFLGDHWIATEPYGGKYFQDIGLDGVVGSVGDGVTLRLIADIDTPITEGRFLPYFFPDTFYEGNNPTIEGRDNWVKARRALLRKPLDRIGYGGYMSLAYKFPEFTDYIAEVANEFRDIHDVTGGDQPRKVATVAVLNSWGKLRSWGAWTIAHQIPYKKSYSYQGILESLSGMDVEVKFLDFEDVKAGIPEDIDVIINAGEEGTSYSGGAHWLDKDVQVNLRKFVHNGGGLIGVGQPTAAQANGRFFQLADVFGLEQERGLSEGVDKYFTATVDSHYITADLLEDLDFGESTADVYAISPDTQIIEYSNDEIHLASNDYGDGRAIYIAGLPYSTQNTRLLKRAIHYVSQSEAELNKYFAQDLRLEVAAYPEKKLYCVVNNSLDTVKSVVYNGKGEAFDISLEPGELRWFEE